MKILFSTIAIIFISFFAVAKDYEWVLLGKNDRLKLYYDDFPEKVNITISKETGNKHLFDDGYGLKVIEGMKLPVLFSYKNTQSENRGRYRSEIIHFEIDCKTYQYRVEKKLFYKKKYIYNSNTEESFGSYNSYSNKQPTEVLDKKTSLSRKIEALCKSLYSRGAQHYLLSDMPQEDRYLDQSKNCKTVRDPLSTLSEKLDAMSKLPDIKGYCNKLKNFQWKKIIK